ncbi:MAG: prepilin-type N-terminal cleavage/methylation domain-containing protein [Desulfitobacteriaceae bacterium]
MMIQKMRKRKEEGFTLIELMIVIAVIGILAIVLIPKVGTIKTQAKAAGIDTNIRTVEGYVQANINNATSTSLETNMVSAFPATGDAVQNPFSPNKRGATGTAPGVGGGPTNAILVDTAVSSDPGAPTTTNTDRAGMVEAVCVKDGSGNITKVYLVAYDQNGIVLTAKTVTLTP